MTMKLAKYLLVRALVFITVFELPFIPMLWVEPLNEITPVEIALWAAIYLKCLLVFLGFIWYRAVGQICDWFLGEFPSTDDEI